MTRCSRSVAEWILRSFDTSIAFASGERLGDFFPASLSSTINVGCSDLRKRAGLFLNVIYFSLCLIERLLSLRSRDPYILCSRRGRSPAHEGKETCCLREKHVFMPFPEDETRDPGSCNCYSFATVFFCVFPLVDQKIATLVFSLLLL